ncbi:MAG TPA: zinc metalloprotease HtpX [Actinomycetota bacterium]|jgi:heat shock protein HtpX|nr:zinc metalloprotease HtpX [Actinomycetota bacterium]
MNKNTFKTAALLAALGALMIGIGSFWGAQGATIGLIVGLVFTGGSYWFSDKIAIAASRAKPVSEAEAPEYYRVVRELSQSAGIPMPRLYITPDTQPNAFATGRNPKNAAVAVTRGLLDVCDAYELRGVLAHELAHVKHRDILISSVAAAVAMAIMFIARMAMWGAIFGGGGRDNNRGGNVIGLLAMMILAPLAAMLIQAAISRSREFEADREGARIAGGGEGLARALEKLEAAAKRVPMNAHPAMEQAYIVSPFGGRRSAANFANLFSTHPPAQERIRRLRSPNLI